MFEVITMKKRFKSYTFVVYADGTYQEVRHNQKSEYFHDFADLFLSLKAEGFKLD